MFDIHTHILPGIDDGSQSVEESLAMIQELARQGVTGIAATPHFYGHRSSPEHFFQKRQLAWERLAPQIPSGLPEIRLGAEVQYFEGINHYEGLEQFCIQGTQLLLVEMPTCTWTARMLAAVCEINRRSTTTVLLAHMERYLPYGNMDAVEELMDQGVLVQVSTGFFQEKKRVALKLLRGGYIHFLGSDAHNMTIRKPDFAPAVAFIRKKKELQWLQELEDREAAWLHEA